MAPRYGFDERGRRKVESKDALKKRLNRSPDRADAVALAVYRPPEVLPTYEGMPNIWLPFTVPASGF